MKLYERDGQRLALVSCFAAALIYVVDLDASSVIGTVVVGTGPHDLVVDEAREALYVANTLEASVSVVDLSSRRGTQFAEIARLGLQEPFTQ
jgi:DNA-binding beta-propeller fold protein YncE